MCEALAGDVGSRKHAAGAIGEGIGFDGLAKKAFVQFVVAVEVEVVGGGVGTHFFRADDDALLEGDSGEGDLLDQGAVGIMKRHHPLGAFGECFDFRGGEVEYHLGRLTQEVDGPEKEEAGEQGAHTGRTQRAGGKFQRAGHKKTGGKAPVESFGSKRLAHQDHAAFFF